MIKDRDTLEYIFKLAKQVKKPLVKIYPNGTIIGTDEQFASLNILIPEVINYHIDNPYIFRLTELSAFMREIKDDPLRYDIYAIEKPKMSRGDKPLFLHNHLEYNFSFDELYSKVLHIQEQPILYKEEEFQNSIPEMFSLKSSDGAKMFTANKKFFMSSFNAIHPANKTDRVDLIIKDYDFYSYTAEFIIYKKKDKYQLHEFLRFRKL